MPRLLTFSLALCLLSTVVAADVWYVDSNTPAVGMGRTGRTWNTAFDTIQAGVDAAFNDGGGEVWVAMGIYAGGGESVLFMRPQVDIYAGFMGNVVGGSGGFETDRSQRDWANHTTVIDGGGEVGCVQGADQARLDGFVLRNGRGVWIPMSPLNRGGGVLCAGTSPTIVNCLFVNCNARYGSAIYAKAGAPTVEDCVFIANASYEGTVLLDSATIVSGCVFVLNTAQYGGSAVHTRTFDAPEIRNCLFVGNTSAPTGGAVSNHYGSSLVVNGLFVGNSGERGGAIVNWYGATPRIVNCTFHRNTAGSNAGAIASFSDEFSAPTTPFVANCILWDSSPAAIYDNEYANTTVVYSNVQGGYPGEGNLSPARDPRFLVGPTGVSTGLAYDSARYKTTLTHTGRDWEPDAHAKSILWITVADADTPYVIAGNTADSITVWGDATRSGAVATPVGYAVLSYRLADDSPCMDAGCDAGVPGLGEVIDDLLGIPRGQDGRGDDPTGPPPPGDGSDYDMGALETPRLFLPADVNRDGMVDAIDLQLVINELLGGTTGYNGDVNGDSFVNALDVQIVVNAILGIG